MVHTDNLQSLSDDELLQRLTALLSQSRRVEADLVAYIGEFDHRRLYASQACSSVFSFCVDVLHLSEPEAYLRITAARAARRFPALLLMLRDGRLHLSAIRLLAPHLTEENCENVLARASYRTKKQVEELIAELAPKPDVPATIRKLPEPSNLAEKELRPDRAKIPGNSQIPPPAPPTRPAPPPVLPVAPRPEPLSPDRFKVTFTASAALRDKLERLQALTGEDLAAVIEAAVTEKLERLEAKRYGATKRPRKTLEESDTSPKSRYIAAAVKRIVCSRDGNQCTFVDGHGRRCKERHGVEFHHCDPFGRGGDHDPSRIRLLCKAHNLLLAERDYGKAVMDRYRKSGSRVSESRPRYGVIHAVPAG